MSDTTGMINVKDGTLLIDGRTLPVIMCSNADRIPCELSEARYVLAGPDEGGGTYLVEIPDFGKAKQ